MKTKIGFNLLPIPKEKTGVGVHARSLLEGFKNIQIEFDIILFCTKDNASEFPLPFKKIVLPLKTQNRLFRIFFEQFIFPFYILFSGVKILHSTSNIIPLLAPVKHIVTIHDLTFLRIQNKFPTIRRIYNRIFVRLSHFRSQRIITVSKSSQKDIYELFGSKKLDLIYQGIRSTMVPSKQVAINHIRRKFNLPSRYLLFVGTLEPGKNVEFLINTFAQLRKSIPKTHLVIAGKKGWNFNSIFDTVSKLDLANYVHFTGFIPDEDLPALYSGSLFLISLSRYEGFGLPIVESFSCGKPAITSDQGSFPEIIPDKRLLVPIEDPNKTAHKILSLQSLINNKKNIHKWRNNILVKYNEQKSAEKHLEIFRVVIQPKAK